MLKKGGSARLRLLFIIGLAQCPSVLLFLVSKAVKGAENA